MNNMNDMSELLDNRDQYRLYRKYMLKHFKTYFVLNLKHIITNRKMFHFKRLIIALSIGVLTYCLILIIAKEVPQVIEGKTIYVSDETKTMESFLEELGQLESRGNYKAINQFNYMGKYQIGFTALKQIGLGSVTKEQFLNNPELQEVAMKMLLKENKKVLSNCIGKYQSCVIKKIYITESSILAAAHLCPKGTMDFLKSNGDSVFRDGNNVPVTKYLKMFSGYKIEL